MIPSPFSVASVDAQRPLKRISRHFIFGYGSLICPHSRSVTAPTLTARDSLPAVLCVVRNLERGWNARIRVEGRLPRRWQIERFVNGGREGDLCDRERVEGGGFDYDTFFDVQFLDGWTAVGVRVVPGRTCAGVLVEVGECELMRFDERESGYDRISIRLEHIERVPSHYVCGSKEVVGERVADEGKHLEEEKEKEEHIVFRRGDFLRRLSSLDSHERSASSEKSESSMNEAPSEEEELNVWVYVQHDHAPADRSYPIKQSYVDIILRGCLSISESFARSFIETTVGWWHNGDGSTGGMNGAHKTRSEGGTTENEAHHTWIDDRNFPLYTRADPDYSNEMGSTLDELLKEHHPKALARRKRYHIRA